MSPAAVGRLGLVAAFAANLIASPNAWAAQSREPVTVADTAAAVRWNVLAQRLWSEADVARRPAREKAEAGDSTALHRFAALPAPQRLMTVLSVAQYHAAAAPSPDRSAAVSAASAAVLEALLPDSASRAAVTRERARDRRAARTGVGGESAGARAAAQLLAWVDGDRHDAEWTGTVPTGDGMWRSRPGAVPGNAAWTLRHSVHSAI